MKESLLRLKRYQFLFEELVKRDFKKKYKRTVLGMAWSVLSPLINLVVMRLLFTRFFGQSVPHYTTYLYCGNMVFSYFSEASGQGMTTLLDNAPIFTKVNVPKYLFPMAKSVQTLINFGLTFVAFFALCLYDQVSLSGRFLLLVYPIFCLLLFNIGVALVLSASYMFFRDMQYLWQIFLQLLNYASAIFYPIDGFSPMVQNLFLLNPVYLFIRYFRKVVIDMAVPSLGFHALMMFEAVFVLALGCWFYKKYNTEFLYYV